MYILRLEHTVKDFNMWKEKFDSDPIGREKHGVQRFRLSRSADNPNYINVELELNTEKEARTLETAVKELWKNLAKDMIIEPSCDILEVVESKELKQDYQRA